jgi:hypothetical protein
VAQVKILWKGDHGEVIPTNFRAKHEEAVSWTAVGSSAAVKFTSKEVFGVDELLIAEGATETVKVLPKAPAGKYTFPIRCEKDPGDGTPPVNVVIG